MKTKNARRVHSTLTGDPVLDARVLILEQNELKVTYFSIISGTSGTITPPVQATFNSNEFGLSGNAILSEVDVNGKPTFVSPKTAGGTVVTATLNTTTGAWLASGVYVGTNVALIYSLKIKAQYWSNLTYASIIESESYHVGAGAIAPITYDAVTDKYTTLMNTNKLLGRSTAGSGVAEEITLGTGLSMTGGVLDASPGVSPASVAEINAGTDNTKFADALNLETSKYLTQNGTKISATLAGTTAMIATITPAITSYVNGQRWFLKVGSTSTGAVTIDLNSIGAKKAYLTPSTQCGSGDLTINFIYLFAYDSTLDSGAGGFLMVGGTPLSLPGTGDRMVEAAAPGTLTATKEIKSLVPTDATLIADLQTLANWAGTGSASLASFTSTRAAGASAGYQGQWYTGAIGAIPYWFICTQDGFWIRISLTDIAQVSEGGTGAALTATTQAFIRFNAAFTAFENSGITGNQSFGTGNAVSFAGLTVNGNYNLTAVTPAQITSSQNNYPTSNALMRISSNAALSITGLTNTANGRMTWLKNVGSFAITFTHEDALSTAANRITSSTGANLVLNPGKTLVMLYDATTSRWSDVTF